MISATVITKELPNVFREPRNSDHGRYPPLLPIRHCAGLGLGWGRAADKHLLTYLYEFTVQNISSTSASSSTPKTRVDVAVISDAAGRYVARAQNLSTGYLSPIPSRHALTCGAPAIPARGRTALARVRHAKGK
jgi:hypothetical protein